MATIRELAQADDRHMDIMCGWATGEGAEAFASWFEGYRVDDFTADEWEAITGFDTNTADLDAPVVVTDAAEASYGGGSENNTWYETRDGTLLVRAAGPWGARFRILSDAAPAMPAITGYRAVR